MGRGTRKSCTWPEQSSGKVECMNTTKIAIGKTMPGNPLTVGSVTAHSLAED
jgi:hypothetical protein